MALDEKAYTTVEVLRQRLNVPDSEDDNQLERVITSASREIDGLCNRRFYPTTATRTFTPILIDQLVIGDVVSVSNVSTDSNGERLYVDEWAVTDYELGPVDAAYMDRPYTELHAIGNYGFSRNRASVRITGVWGWSTVPAEIEEATLLIATRLWQRKLSPFGAAGTTTDGQIQYIPRNDPDAKVLIEPFRWYQVGPV